MSLFSGISKIFDLRTSISGTERSIPCTPAIIEVTFQFSKDTINDLYYSYLLLIKSKKLDKITIEVDKSEISKCNISFDKAILTINKRLDVRLHLIQGGELCHIDSHFDISEKYGEHFLIGINSSSYGEFCEIIKKYFS